MSSIEMASGAQDGRVVQDRRQFGWRTVFYGFIRSRRRDSRRESEAEPVFTDWHHPWLFFLAVGTMVLSCMDAFFTLQLLDRGATEINPVMDALIGRSTQLFAATKTAMTGVGIMMLVFLSRFRFMDRFRTGIILTVIFSFYACLVCYEFVYLLAEM